MDKVAALSPKDRSDLFSETAAKKGTTPAIIEKDFWVTWTLFKLFGNDELSRILRFKGGTSLSKVFNLIERFSEDIDLILDWRVITGEDPKAERSKTKQQKFNKEINEQAQAYIAGELLAKISACVEPVCSCTTVEEDPSSLNVLYPGAFRDDYLKPEVRLEIGPLASWLPFDEYSIRSYAAEEFPKVFEMPECTVTVIKAERTFWEKATILHQEAFRPDENPQPSHYSRHYYDLVKMAEGSVKDDALAEIGMLERVAEFKEKFYPRGWARYDLAKVGTLKLVPEGHVLKSLRSDYRAMEHMIYGDYPDFEDILSTLQKLENEINALKK